MPDHDTRRDVREVGFGELDELVLASAATIHQSRPWKSITNSDASGSMLRTTPVGSSAGRGEWKDSVAAIVRSAPPDLDFGDLDRLSRWRASGRIEGRMFTRG